MRITTVRDGVGLLGMGMALVTGCHSLGNGWLDPTVLGTFDRSATLNIRSSLTLEDAPRGIPGASLPTLGDLRLVVEEHPISAGDALEIEINELRQRQVPYLAQVQVASTGYVNLPVVGRVDAAGLTVPEFEAALAQALRERNVLYDPEVTVNPVFLQRATYSIFGVGVSAANDAPLRAGTFPIRRPDLRVLEAINQVGGLNEFVTDVFIFREEGGPTPTGSINGTGGNFGRSDSFPMGDRLAPVEPIPDESGASSTPAVDSSPERTIEEALEPGEPAAGDDGAARDRVDDRASGPSEDGARAQLLEPIDENRGQPFLWLHGEFVPNPAYPRAAPPGSGNRTGMAPLESGAPLVNWSRWTGENGTRIIQIPADSLRSADPLYNIYVRAGDVIRIVSGEIGVYYVMGQVNRVGPFGFNAEPVTLKAAIAAAGGLTSLAWPDRCTVYRRLGQREQIIQVDLDRIFAGLDPDFLIRRGDIINVGTHPFAPFLQRIRDFTLPNIASNVGYSFTYARNFADIDSFAVQQNPENRPRQFPNLFP